MINFTIACSAKDTKEIQKEQICEELAAGKIIWMDITYEEGELPDYLTKIFGLHPLAVEDCMQELPRSKVDEYPEALSITMHRFYYVEPAQNSLFKKNPQFPTMQIEQLNFFIGQNFLVSVHKHPSKEILRTLDHIKLDPKIAMHGQDYIFYLIADQVVDSYFTEIDHLDDLTDRLEEDIFKKQDSKISKDLFNLKRDTLHIRKLVVPQREIFAMLVRFDERFINQSNLVYFRDIYDHLIRIADSLDVSRDLLTSLLDAHLTVISNKMNEIMKVLTVIATLVMPPTLIAGIYGMNFHYIPEIHSAWGLQYGYFLAIGMMVLIMIILAVYFKRKRWI